MAVIEPTNPPAPAPPPPVGSSTTAATAGAIAAGSTTSGATTSGATTAAGSSAGGSTVLPASDASVKDLGLDLKDLVVAYAKQETIDPLKSLGRYVAYGVAGAVLLAVGTFLGALAILRAVQTEASPSLTGNLSFVPYFAGVVFAGVVAAAAASRIGRRP